MADDKTKGGHGEIDNTENDVQPSEAPNPDDFIQYGSNYSEKGFLDKAKETVLSLSEEVIKKALSLYYIALNDKVDIQKKILIYGALGYFILPIDVIPDFIVALGYVDDIALLTAMYKQVSNIYEENEDIRNAVEQKYNELLGKQS